MKRNVKKKNTKTSVSFETQVLDPPTFLTMLSKYYDEMYLKPIPGKDKKQLDRLKRRPETLLFISALLLCTALAFLGAGVLFGEYLFSGKDYAVIANISISKKEFAFVLILFLAGSMIFYFVVLYNGYHVRPTAECLRALNSYLDTLSVDKIGYCRYLLKNLSFELEKDVRESESSREKVWLVIKWIGTTLLPFIIKGAYCIYQKLSSNPQKAVSLITLIVYGILLIGLIIYVFERLFPKITEAIYPTEYAKNALRRDLEYIIFTEDGKKAQENSGSAAEPHA